MTSSLGPLVDIPPGATLVVRGALAGRQWEAFLAREALARGARCWRTPPVVPYGRWLAERWSETDDAEAVLGRRQALALWRAVIDGSPARERLIAVEGPARWAAEAWALLERFRIDPATLTAGPAEPDFRAFLAWCRDYAAALRERRWIDPAELEGRLAARGFPRPGSLVLADHDAEDMPPAQRALLEAWVRAGGTATPLATPACAPRRVRVPLADAEEERRVAAEWVRRRLAENPSARVALVVPDLAQSIDDVERALDEAFDGERGRWWSPYAGSLARDPVVGAALARIALLTPAGTFAHLSRWLRELPPSGAPAAATRAVLERELRDDVAAQLPFLAAYRSGGWRRRLHDAAPDLAVAIDGALRELGEQRLRTPSAWAAAWQRALARLEWPPPQSPHDTLRAWEAALGELRALTPVLGAVTAAQALRELEAITSAQRRPAPLPVAGVFVLAHPDEVGPGYDAVWLTGFADARWPEPTRLNPLLPRRLQRAHGMPWATPQDALRRSERSLARLCAGVPEVVASWPARLHDYAAGPSPALREFAELSREELRGDGRPARPRAATRLEILADPAPPWPGTSLRGGAGVLKLQARAPLRAFCQYRLGARALDPVTSGVPPRLQGIAAHRALESLYGPLIDAAGADPTPLPSAARADAAAEAALAAVFGEAREPLRTLFRLERDRLADALRALLAAEAERPPFVVEAVERKELVTVAGRTLEVRIDRLDRLADGTLAILDYKTGDAANAGDWLKERLGDAQVPLYAVHLAPEKGAAVLVTLAPAGTEYSGIWERSGAFPGRRRAPRDDAWSSQLAAWRAQLETLVDELAAGDVRVFVSDLELLDGAYAPLTRIREQLALHRAAMRHGSADD